jgi:4-amino-4-deoxy-L-arabinose transferase-like glycosyltransferase
MEKVMACGTIASGDCHKLATRTRVPKRKGVAGATLDLAVGILGSANCHVYLMAGAMLFVAWATRVVLVTRLISSGLGLLLCFLIQFFHLFCNS